MERLTIRSKNNMVWFKDAENGNAHLEPCEMTAHHNRMTLDKLATYEDAEEQGLLLRLPCKVGDTAWYVCRSGMYEVEIDSFVVNINLFVNVSYYIGCERFGKMLTPYKTLFFTREEAKAKLKEMNCFQNGNS